jgi:hypothetical protein
MTRPAGALAGAALPIARYRFTAVAESDLPLPHYAGSLLRGAFGAALRRSVCMTGLPACSPCPLYGTCPYPAIFEAPPRPTPLPQRFTQVPNPYVIEPPPPGTRAVARGAQLEFHMVLVGTETLRQLPLIVHAWQRALRHGLGRDRVPARLTAVGWCAEDGGTVPVLDAATGHVLPHEATLSVPPAPPALTALRLHLGTPMRLQRDGRPLGVHELDVRTLVLAAVRRATLMLHLHAGIDHAGEVEPLLTAAAGMRDDRSDLRWQDWTRYSSRQRQEMTLGGVVGTWSLAGELQQAWPWLWLGQWLHVGKNATMGLGRYRLEAEA